MIEQAKQFAPEMDEEIEPRDSGEDGKKPDEAAIFKKKNQVITNKN